MPNRNISALCPYIVHTREVSSLFFTNILGSIVKQVLTIYNFRTFLHGRNYKYVYPQPLGYERRGRCSVKNVRENCHFVVRMRVNGRFFSYPWDMSDKTTGPCVLGRIRINHRQDTNYWTITLLFNIVYLCCESRE